MSQESKIQKHFRLQIISIPGLEVADVLNEDAIIGNPYINFENLNSTICEIYLINPGIVPLLFGFFMVDAEEISSQAWKLKMQSRDSLAGEFLDVNYLRWIEISGQENTMDEFGQLLEFQNILRTNSHGDIYAVLRI
jgi:hypothetical protein